LALCDVTGDDVPDMLVSIENGVYYRDTSSGIWSEKLGEQADHLACGDVDEDGKADVLVNYLTGTTGVWIHYSTTGIWASLTYEADDIVLGDMNNDHHLDLVGVW